jgi:signal transduction histidine kinase
MQSFRSFISDAPPQEQCFALNRFTLQFKNKDLERTFVEETFLRTVSILRFSILVGTLCFAVFALLDKRIIPEIYETTKIIRFGIMVPLMLGFIGFTYNRNFRKISQLSIAIVMVLASITIDSMIVLAQGDGRHLYYPGLIMVGLFAMGMARLHFIYAMMVNIFILIIYTVTAVFLNPINNDLLMNNLFFMGSTLSMGAFAGYFQELYLRKDFIAGKIIAAAKKESEILLEKSEAANRAKSDFLAVMSHELRTPLNAIIGFSEIMSNEMFGAIGNAQYKEYAVDISQSGNHLLTIISDILDYSKAEAGYLQIHDEDIVLANLLNDLLRLFREKVAEKRIRLAFDIPKKTIVLRIDSRIVKQIILNLIANAIKFTKEGGAIVCRLELSDDGCTLIVQDTGIGIAPENIEDVLKPFVQVENVFTRVNDGTGLGLPLVKKFIEAHQGSIHIDSTLGVGTTIYIRFPKERIVGITNIDEEKVSAS